MDISKKIRQLRESLNITQAELSRRSGLPQAVISRLESGKRVRFEVGTLASLAEGLEVGVPELVQEGRPDPDRDLWRSLPKDLRQAVKRAVRDPETHRNLIRLLEEYEKASPEQRAAMLVLLGASDGR